MSGSDLTPEPDRPVIGIERPEIVALAVRLLTGEAPEGADLTLPLESSDVERQIASQYEMTPRNARRYVERARELIAAEFTADLPHRARALSVISLSVAREAHRDRNWQGVNGAVRNLCTIYGIDKIKMSGPDGLAALLTAAQADPGARDREIADLEARDAEERERGPDAG